MNSLHPTIPVHRLKAMNRLQQVKSLQSVHSMKSLKSMQSPRRNGKESTCGAESGCMSLSGTLWPTTGRSSVFSFFVTLRRSHTASVLRCGDRTIRSTPGRPFGRLYRHMTVASCIFVCRKYFRHTKMSALGEAVRYAPKSQFLKMYQGYGKRKMRTTQGGQSQDLQVQFQTGRRAEHPLSEDARRGRMRKEQIPFHRFAHLRLRVPRHAKRSLQSAVYCPAERSLLSVRPCGE